MNEDIEPEVQHLDRCDHPVGPCTCPRDYLLAEARRIREMCLFAESELARENRRAVDLKIERDQLRERNGQRAGILLHLASVLGDAPTRTEAELPNAVARVMADRDKLIATRQDLLDALGHIALALVPTNAPPGIVDFGDAKDLPDAVRRVVAERDRLDAVVGEYGLNEDEPLVAVVAERNRLRAALAETRQGLEYERLVKYAAYEDTIETELRLHDAETERNRLRAVVEAARELVEARRVWFAKAEAGGVTSADPESVRRQAAIERLDEQVAALDEVASDE